MDYGQPVSNSSEAGFFTAGVGDTPENLNPDVNDSLNVNTMERNTREIGNVAIYSSESVMSASQPESFIGDAERLESRDMTSQIIDPEMPPGQETTNQGTKSQQPMPDNIVDFTKISREKDKISDEAIKAVEKATADYKKDVISPARYYDFKSNATEAYMKTFGDKATWGKELAA